jgi:serine/threonine protein kinase
MNENKPYDGKKVDIFCLGEALMILVTGIPGFELATRNNRYYQQICRKNIGLYWKIVEPQLKPRGIILSQEFKDLYIKMVTYNPNSRPNAETVLNHPWFDEIKELKKNKEKMEKIEDEIKQKFIDLEQNVKEGVKKYLEANNSSSEEDDSIITRSAGDEGMRYFNGDIKAKNIDTQINMNNCIKIKNLLNPNKFMNFLCQKMINEFGQDNCYIETSKKRLKLEVIFEEDEKEKDELPEEIKEELKKLGIDYDAEEYEENNDLKMNIKLYKYSDEYILKFIQKEGKRNQFLDKFRAISKLVENIIS